MDRVLMVGHKKGGVEHVMDFPHFGEAELIHDQKEDFDDCEGLFLLEGEYGIGNGPFEVSGFQPDFVTFDKWGGSSVVTQGHDLVGKFMYSEGFVSCGDEGF